MRTILIILTMVGLLGCNNQEDNKEELDCLNLDTLVYFNFKNSEGQNLFEKATKNSYDIKNVKQFDVNSEGKKIIHFTPELSSKKNLIVHTSPYKFKIIEKKTEEDIVESITYLQLSETVTDTIKTYSRVGKCYFIVSKLWYNGKLVWSEEDDKQLLRLIEITK